MKNLLTKNSRVTSQIISGVILATILFPLVSFAQITNPLGNDYTLEKFFANILQIVVTLGASVIVVFFIYAGFKYVTAMGDEAKIKEATQTLTYAAIGAAILLGAQVLQTVISNTVQQLGK